VGFSVEFCPEKPVEHKESIFPHLLLLAYRPDSLSERVRVKGRTVWVTAPTVIFWLGYFAFPVVLSRLL